MFELDDIDRFSNRIGNGFQRLVDNDDLLSNRFLKNIEVLKEYFPSIYDAMKSYKPENKNIFMEEDGALNIFFPETKYTLFSERPFAQIDQRYKEFASNPARTYLDIEPGDDARTLHEKHLSEILRKRKEFLEERERYRGLPDVVGSIILFGFELGYQLVRILDQHYAKHIYVYEKDLDLFYYSLYAIDWEWIASEMIERDTTLHLFLGIDEKEFFSKFTQNIRYNGLYMAPHTYMYMGYDRKVVDEFSNQYLRLVMGWGFFDDGVIGISHYLSRRNDTYLAQDLDKSNQVSSFKNLDYPVLILGNGPSLDRNIDFIKERAGEAIIISCGTTVNTLQKYGVKPDFHADVERLKYTAEKLKSLDPDYLSGIDALTVNVMHPEFYDYFDRSIIGLKPGEPISSIMLTSDLISKENRKKLSVLHYSAPIVANLALSYVMKMGFSEVYLIGVDCGFKDPAVHHSKLSGYYKNDGSNTGLAEYSSGLIPRDANFGGIAFTTSLMDTSRAQLELLIGLAKKNNKLFNCFNLSDGVKINGAIALDVGDVLPFKRMGSSKSELKDFVFSKFAKFELDAYGERDFGEIHYEYIKFCDECLIILDKDFDDKKGFLTLLTEFNSFLMKQNFSMKVYNCELMMGSFIYAANEMVSLVLSTPEDTINEVKVLVDMFKDFIREMPTLLEDPMAYVDKGNNALEGRYNA